MRVVSWSIAAPTLPAEVLNQAKGVSREKALTFDADRLHILLSCALECERWIGRALWPGNRTAYAVVRVSDATEDVPLFPMLPDTTGVQLGLPVVRVWSDTAEDWTVATYKKRPAGRVRVSVSSGLENTRSPSTAVPSSTIPPEAVEGVSRLFAYRETLRPGDLSEIAGEQQVLSGAVMKSGCAEVLRAITLTL